MILEEVVIIKNRRGPSVPWLVVLAKSVQEFLGADMTLSDLTSDVPCSFQVLGKNNVVRTKLRLQTFRRTLAVSLDVTVAAGEIGGS